MYVACLRKVYFVVVERHRHRESGRSFVSAASRSTAHTERSHTSSRARPSHMARSVSEEATRKDRRKSLTSSLLPSFTNNLVNIIGLDSGDFTSRWCNERKLNENTAVVLRQRGFIDEQSLASLRAEDVPTLGLTSKAEECVLRKVLVEQEGVRPLHVDVADSSVQFREFCSTSIILERCDSQCYVCLSRFRSRSTETSQPSCEESERTELLSVSREFPRFDRSQYRQPALFLTF